MAKSKPTQLMITVSPDGTVSTDFLHFTGNACLHAGRQLHTLLAEFGLETEVTGFTPRPELAGAPAALMVSQEELLQEGGQ